MWYICGNILLRIFRHISVYITYTVAYFDILFEFRMFSEYHFSDMEIYHITNFTRITRILLSILLILLISSFRGKSSTRLGGNRSVIPSPSVHRTVGRGRKGNGGGAQYGAARRRWEPERRERRARGASGRTEGGSCPRTAAQRPSRSLGHAGMTNSTESSRREKDGRTL